jgi:hypothetical protein
VDRFVATGRPTRALRQAVRVIGIADENAVTGFLFLEVALQTQGLVALVQHPGVDRPVGRVATHAAFFQRFMLEHEWPGLGNVTLETGLIFPEQQNSAAFDSLRQTGIAAFDRAADVRVMAIGTTHLAFQHRMVVRHLKSCPNFQVTLEAGVRRSPRIDNLALIAAAGDVKTSRSMARFASHLLGVITRRFQTRMGRSPKVFGDRFVTSLARF